MLGCATECCVTKETDCQDYKDNGYTESGVYRVIPLGTRFGLDVYCDMTTDGGGWLVSFCCFTHTILACSSIMADIYYR